MVEIHQIAFKKHLEFKKLPSFQHALKWNSIFTTGKYVICSTLLSICFCAFSLETSLKLSFSIKQYMKTNTMKKINSLPTSIEWTIFQTNKSDICVGCYVILDTLGPDCGVNWVQGSATKYRWYLSIITVAKSREMF